MSQQINLLNPALIKKTDFLNPNNIALLLGVLLLGFVAYYQYENHALAKLKVSREQLATQVSTMETQLNLIRTARTASTSNVTLLNTIKELEQKTMIQEEIIKAVGQNSAQSSKSYATLLKAFSKQSVDGLWITGLSIDQDAQALSIKGRALHADLLPAFIARLRAEPALKGKTFTDLKMQSATVSQEKSALKPQINEAQTNGGQVSPIASANNTGITNNQTSAGLSQTQQKYIPPAYVEFTLHSVAEKEKVAAPIAAAEVSP